MKKLRLTLILISILLVLPELCRITAQTKETNPEYLKSSYGFRHTLESQNFIVHYRDSLLKGDKINSNSIKYILAAQENNLKSISEKTGVDYSRFNSLEKINIWLFTDHKEQLRITQINSPAFCIHPFWSLYFHYDIAENKHELAHLISQEYWGWFASNKYQMLICEGFANYVDEWGVKKSNFRKSAKKIIGNKKDFIQRMIDNSLGFRGFFVNPYKQDIVISSAFVNYLIDSFGIEKFEQLWKKLKEDETIFQSVYGKDFKALNNEFYSTLKR